MTASLLLDRPHVSAQRGQRLGLRHAGDALATALEIILRRAGLTMEDMAPYLSQPVPESRAVPRSGAAPERVSCRVELKSNTPRILQYPRGRFGSVWPAEVSNTPDGRNAQATGASTPE